MKAEERLVFAQMPEPGFELIELAQQAIALWREFATQFDYKDEHRKLCCTRYSDASCDCGLDEFFVRLEAFLDGGGDELAQR